MLFYRECTVVCIVVLIVTLTGQWFAGPVQAHPGLSQEISRLSLQIDKKPESVQLYLLRADLQRRNQHWDEAHADLLKADSFRVELDDTEKAMVDLGRGLVFMGQQRPVQALPYLNRAIAVRPDDVRARVARAKVFLALDKPLSAASDFQVAIKHKPLPDYYFQQAKALDIAGDIGAAIQALDSGIKTLGNLRILADYAIELERKRQHYQAALSRLDKIIGRSPRKDSLLLKRGDILFESGDYHEAVASYEAAEAAIAALPLARRQTVFISRMQADIQHRKLVLQTCLSEPVESCNK